MGPPHFGMTIPKKPIPTPKEDNDDGVQFYPGHQLHFLGVPDINGPAPSIRVSQWCRGYQDYKYFFLLKQKAMGPMPIVW